MHAIKHGKFGYTNSQVVETVSKIPRERARATFPLALDINLSRWSATKWRRTFLLVPLNHDGPTRWLRFAWIRETNWDPLFSCFGHREYAFGPRPADTLIPMFAQKNEYHSRHGLYGSMRRLVHTDATKSDLYDDYEDLIQEIFKFATAIIDLDDKMPHVEDVHRICAKYIAAGDHSDEAGLATMKQLLLLW